MLSWGKSNNITDNDNDIDDTINIIIILIAYDIRQMCQYYLYMGVCVGVLVYVVTRKSY